MDRNKWEGGLLVDTRTRDKEELIDLATRKQGWNKNDVQRARMRFVDQEATLVRPHRLA